MIDWEDRYREGDTPWDKGGPHPMLERLLPLSVATTRVLVPGCGPGYDLISWAQVRGVERVVGIDVAESAVRAAQARTAGMAGVHVEVADLFALGAAHRGAYDLVWEHTCFCAIDPTRRNAYVNAVADALAPGGHLLAVFFLTPWDTPEENATLGPPHGCSAEELDRRFAPRFEIIEVTPVPATYPGREGREQRRLLRRI
ncbi:MAG: methyltransferase domain-containing protein [Verrucomicrobiales bacterium]